MPGPAPAAGAPTVHPVQSFTWEHRTRLHCRPRRTSTATMLRLACGSILLATTWSAEAATPARETVNFDFAW